MSTPSYPRCRVRLQLLLEDWTGTGAASQTFDLSVDPIDATIERNDHRTADKATVTLDLRDFPFDPRTYRACRVTVFLADVGDPAGQLSEVDAQFVGFVDLPRTSRGPQGSEVALECRDYTGVFLDTRWTAGAVDITKPLSAVVDGIVAAVPGTSGMPAPAFSAGASTVTLATVLGRTRYTPQPGDDAWSVLSDLVGRAGLVPVFALDRLMVLQPSDFGADPTTYTLTGALDAPRVSLAYGRDLEEYEVRRKFNEARTLQVEVRAYDETTRTVKTARYPAASVVMRKRVTATGKVSETAAPILPFHVSGTYTQADLAALAERVWQDAARREVEVRVKTRAMADSVGQGIPALGNGSRLTVTVADSITTEVYGQTQAQAVRALTTGDRAMAPDVATAFVASLQSANGLGATFYAQTVRHRWHRSDGYSAEITAINYLGGSA